MNITKEKCDSEAVPVRAGWAEAASKIAESGGDELLTGEFDNAKDSYFLRDDEQIRSLRELDSEDW